MNIIQIKECIKSKRQLYIYEKKIEILNMYELFNICEIRYIESRIIKVVNIKVLKDEPVILRRICLSSLKRGELIGKNS